MLKLVYAATRTAFDKLHVNLYTQLMSQLLEVVVIDDVAAVAVVSNTNVGSRPYSQCTLT